MDDARKSEGGHRLFIQRLLIVFALVVLAAFLWRVLDLVLLVFGAVIIATIFHALAEPLHRRTGLPRGAALGLSVLLVFGLLGGAAWMLGSTVSAQVDVLTEAVPRAWRALEARLGEWGLGERINEWVESAAPSGSGVLSSISSFALSIGAGIADTLLVVVGGIYLAAQPELYRSGLLKLVSPRRRALVDDAMGDSGRALALWLKGQLVSMLIIGVLTGVGLWLIGVPSALALGILAGLLEFIPIVGPVVAAVPALLLALALDTTTTLYTLGLYILIQQIEGNVVQPMVQQRAVDLPPALLLFSLIASGLVFGALGIILAAPLTVVVYVLVKRLYVREALDTPTTMPGEAAK